MPMIKPRVLAVAARSTYVGCVHLIDGQLADWGHGEIHSVEEATAKLRSWLDVYKPDVLVTEDPKTEFKKSGKQIPILEAFVEIGREAPAMNIVMTRKKTHKNLYLQAASLAEHYPEIASRVPKKPPIWLPGHRNLVYFDALALAKRVVEGDADGFNQASSNN